MTDDVNDQRVDDLSGNASEYAKAAMLNKQRSALTQFGHEAMGKLKIVSVDINPLPMGKKKEVVLVCEIVVQQGQYPSTSFASY